MVQGEKARGPWASARAPSPLATYHAPTTGMARGRKRHEAKTPRPKEICQRPGAIQRLCGAKRASTKVIRPPATAAGTNCQVAAAINSSARSECRRRERPIISPTITTPEIAATVIQRVRNGAAAVGVCVHSACPNAARAANTPVAANAVGPRPWKAAPRAIWARMAPISASARSRSLMPAPLHLCIAKYTARQG